MPENLNSFEEIANAVKQLTAAGRELGDPAVPVSLATFSLAKSPRLTLEGSEFAFSAGLEAAVEEYNSEDDRDADGILLPDADAAPPLLLTKKDAWLKYRLGGTLRLKGGAEISSVGFSLDAKGSLALFDYRVHSRPEKVTAAVAADVASPRFVFDAAHVLALKSGEALALRAAGSLKLGVTLHWSDVVTSGLRSLTSLLRAATPVTLQISTGLTAGLDVTLSGEFLVVFSGVDETTLRLGVRKASTLGATGTVTAGLSAKAGNLDAALGAVLDSLVGGKFDAVLEALGKATPGALTASEQKLFDGLVTRFGLESIVTKLPDLAKWLAGLRTKAADALRKAAESRVTLGVSYEYGRSETNELFLDLLLLKPATFRPLHADLVKGNVVPLLEDLKANPGRYDLKRFLRRDTLTVDESWGFSLSVGDVLKLKGIDTEKTKKVTEKDALGRTRIAYDALRGYSASFFGDEYAWTTNFSARMTAFTADPKASDFDYGLHLSFQPSSKLGADDAGRLLDLANLWRAEGPDAVSPADLEGALKKRPVRFTVELALPEAALAEVVGRATDPRGPDRLPEALAGALPFRTISPVRQRVGLRTAVYAPLWRAVLENPDLRLGGPSSVRLWAQNALRGTDRGLSFLEAQPRISGTFVDVLEKQSYFFNPPNSLLGHVARFRSGIASLAHVLGSQAAAVSPEEIPFAYQQLLPFLSQSFFLNAFARYILLLAEDAGATGLVSGSARLDFNGGADALVF